MHEVPVMPPQPKPRKRTRRVDAQPSMGALSVRMPAEFVAWLNFRSVEDDTTVGQVIRDCVATAIVRSGDAEAFGIPVVDEGPS